MVTRVYSRATAGNARRFLMDLLGELPIPLLSVQVDGGSEFMADFEDACQKLGVPLHVLPPRRPQWNGCVERANRSARTEFWSLYNGPLTVADVAPGLADYEFFFNYERPHASLAYRTPNEYLVALEAA
ncbi:MAG: integrase core domain-containing protein [Gammaproteobacteria bacterium]|nr:integrase core domain-containing protein [Gammaproteobacteria bacterium]